MSKLTRLCICFLAFCLFLDGCTERTNVDVGCRSIVGMRFLRASVPDDGAAWSPADWPSRCCRKRSFAGSSGMPSLCGFVPWQRSICSVDDLNGRSYAKFHPSLHFSAVFPLLLERLRRPFGSASDARGRGSFRHGTVGYFPAIVGGRVSRQPLFRGSGPVRSADAQILQHWG